MREGAGLGRRFGVTLIVAIGMGLVVGLVAALLDFASQNVLTLSLLTLVHAGLALAAGGLLAALFGRGGAFGWVLALATGALITAVVSFLASFLAAFLGPTPDLNAAFEALPDAVGAVTLNSFAVPVALLASPFLGLFWVSLVSAVHAAAGGARQT